MFLKLRSGWRKFQQQNPHFLPRIKTEGILPRGQKARRAKLMHERRPPLGRALRLSDDPRTERLGEAAELQIPLSRRWAAGFAGDPTLFGGQQFTQRGLI